MRPTPLPEFPAETDALPDGLEREIPAEVETWEEFYEWLERPAEGEKMAFYDRANESEFGLVAGETTEDIDAQIREVSDAIAFDHCLLELLAARIERRHRRIDFLRSVREDYEEWDIDAELERLGCEDVLRR